jgi:hypothetical protein
MPAAEVAPGNVTVTLCGSSPITSSDEAISFKRHPSPPEITRRTGSKRRRPQPTPVVLALMPGSRFSWPEVRIDWCSVCVALGRRLRGRGCNRRPKFLSAANGGYSPQSTARISEPPPDSLLDIPKGLKLAFRLARSGVYAHRCRPRSLHRSSEASRAWTLFLPPAPSMPPIRRHPSKPSG